LSGALCSTCASPLEPAKRVLMHKEGQRAILRVPRATPIALYVKWPQAVVKVDSLFCRAVVRVRSVRVQNDGASGQWLVGGEFVSLFFQQSRGGFLSAEA